MTLTRTKQRSRCGTTTGEDNTTLLSLGDERTSARFTGAVVIGLLGKVSLGDTVSTDDDNEFTGATAVGSSKGDESTLGVITVTGVGTGGR